MIHNFTVEDIQNKIKEYSKVNRENKNEYGEVFTPYVQVNVMLDKIPKEVWTNPELKFLDPANGIGNFPMVAYLYLMDGLKLWQPNDQIRSNHIIKNMLYMIELNPVNVEISRSIFGPDANIHCGSFLDDDCPYNHPDIIMGNPPFNRAITQEQKNIGGGYGGRTLWDKFIIKSMDILNDNGYLTFINPANWRGLGPLNSIWKLFIKHQIHYIQINGMKSGMSVFNVGSRFDNYLVQKRSYTEPTLIIDECGDTHRFKVDKLPFLPNYAYDLILPLITEEGEGVIYSRSAYGTDKPHVCLDVIMSHSCYHTRKDNKTMNKQTTPEHIYPVVHSINKHGLGCWYSNRNDNGHFGVPKVLLNFNAKQYNYPEQNDWEGKYGMSQLTFGIPITSKEEGDTILKAMGTDKFKTLIKATKWATFQTDYRMFKYLKNDLFSKLLE